MILKKNNVIEFIIVGFIISIITYFYNFSPSGPDALLYKGLGENLINDIGYYDTIRNDETLPSIGYPFLLSIFFSIGLTNGILISKIFLFLTLIFSFYTFRITKLNSLISGLLTLIISMLLPHIAVFGVELVLALSIVLIWFGVALHYLKYNWKTGLFLGLFILIHILIRPIILPYIFIVGLVFIIFSFKSISFLFKNGIIILIVFVGYFSILTISNIKYKDSRLTSSTYSSIPLFCAYNNYINLNTNYYSTNWKDVPEPQKSEALSLMSLNDGSWKERDRKLKVAVINFLKNNPSKAISGYFYRLGKYTIFSDTRVYFFTFLLYLFLLIKYAKNIVLKEMKFNFIQVIIIFAPSYIIMIQSVFPYAGSRYLLTPGIYLLFGTVALISILIKSLKTN